MIVTNNTKDFPAKALEEFEIEAQTPDEFIHHLIDLYPDEVLDAANTHRASLLNPPKTREEYLITLERQGCRSRSTPSERFGFQAHRSHD